MLARAVTVAVVIMAAVALRTSMSLAASAEKAGVPPPPPGGRLETLPRKPGDKPQEAAVAVNPRDPQQVVVSYQHAVGDGTDHHPGVTVNAHVAWSRDGGHTWAIADNTTHKRYRRSLDTTIAFDLHGHAFLAYIGMDKMSFAPKTTRHGEFVHRSLDGGRTWEDPITLVEHPETPDGQMPLFEHMPNLVADNHPGSPYAGNLYIVWDRQTFDASKPGISFVKTDIMLARSTDDGKTWSSPRAISSHPTMLMHTTAVSHDGSVYVMYTLNAPMPRVEGDREWKIRVEVSRDGGRTFEAPLPVVNTMTPKAETELASWGVVDFPRAGGWPVMAMDPRGSGRLFVVWGDHRDGDRDILCTTSADRGRTWSKPVRVNDDPKSNGKDQVMQWLAVDPTDGAAYVIFYDRRYDPRNLLAGVTLARSIDGGRTFVNYAWNAATTDPKLSSLGDYLGLAALDGRVYGAWPESVPASEVPATGRAPEKAGEGELEMDDEQLPRGPSAMRVGVADFRGTRTAAPASSAN